jgi:hypothetical protein
VAASEDLNVLGVNGDGLQEMSREEWMALWEQKIYTKDDPSLGKKVTRLYVANHMILNMAMNNNNATRGNISREHEKKN